MYITYVRFIRYNAEEEVLVKDLPSKSRDLMRRFALVERAKDASIVGIVVGTLGVAGYNEAIQRVREIVASAGQEYSSYYIYSTSILRSVSMNVAITRYISVHLPCFIQYVQQLRGLCYLHLLGVGIFSERVIFLAGKKSYTMLMGRPNPAKLANFPECDVFVIVACAQTVLLDSKEYLAPLITPFEAELAFVDGKEWTGAFNLELSQLPKSREGLLHNGDDARTPLTGLLLVTFCVWCLSSV